MIDAQAVLDDLAQLRALAPKEQGSAPAASLDWLFQQLQHLPVSQHRDVSGNYWIRLSGASQRTVMLGSSLAGTLGHDQLDGRLGVAAGLETFKALAQRTQGHPPCTLQLVVWADPVSGSEGGAPSGGLDPAYSGTFLANVAAYLELHIEPGGQLEHAGTPLGVATAAGTAAPTVFNSRLAALCDEAIRELTGTSATLPAAPAQHVAEVARLGVPTAMMYVQALGGSAVEQQSDAARLHMLQAAEAFGRWAESTMHLVAGEELDLWAREHRTPHV